ncbi:hypothetical protein HLV38_01635 [Berryella wangjianweii]|uniref:Uncharacterized protein n=1 Tax=Berryella wangjianweii TaxID=2734634 RepID=A0A6M8J5K7_9ACTN|nr:hypothetical protein [Berryella wangjianweii]QKF06968.1 hypothetical protein HLV38_01635 [Berryella wangjianweii]
MTQYKESKTGPIPEGSEDGASDIQSGAGAAPSHAPGASDELGSSNEEASAYQGQSQQPGPSQSEPSRPTPPAGAPIPPQGFSDAPEPRQSRPEYLLLGMASIRATPEQAERIRSARGLLSFANVAGPVSLLIGGVVLSAAGLVMALVGWRRMVRLGEEFPDNPAVRKVLARQGLVSIAVCAVALALNVATMIAAFPTLMHKLESGELASVLNGGKATPNAPAAPAPNTTWG